MARFLGHHSLARMMKMMMTSTTTTMTLQVTLHLLLTITTITKPRDPTTVLLALLGFLFFRHRPLHPLAPLLQSLVVTEPHRQHRRNLYLNKSRSLPPHMLNLLLLSIPYRLRLLSLPARLSSRNPLRARACWFRRLCRLSSAPPPKLLLSPRP